MNAEAITLRRARPDDAPAVLVVMGHPEVLPNLLQLPWGTPERMRQYLTELEQPGKTDLMLLAERGGRVVGSAGLHPASHQVRRRHAAMLGISVTPEAQGQGVGHALMTALCDYADHWAHWLRIELTVFTDNARAIRLYERMGFRHEGTHRAYALRHGRYDDVHAMARLHPSPPALPLLGERADVRTLT